MKKHSETTEEEVLYDLIKGDHAAFNLLYQKYKSDLFMSILRLTKSHDLAAELLQEVFVKVWNARSSIDTAKPFKAYLYTIARNAVYDFFRKAAQEAKLQERLLLANRVMREENQVEEALYYRESLKILEAGLEKLPLQCRKVFQLSKIEGKSYQEVSVMLGISTATINNHIVKGTKILKRFLRYGKVILIFFF